MEGSLTLAFEKGAGARVGVSHHGLWGRDWDHRGDGRVKAGSPPSPYPRDFSPGGLGAAALWSGSSPLVKAGGRRLRPTSLGPPRTPPFWGRVGSWAGGEGQTGAPPGILRRGGSTGWEGLGRGGPRGSQLAPPRPGAEGSAWAAAGRLTEAGAKRGARGEQQRQVVLPRPCRQVPPVAFFFPDAAAGVGFGGRWGSSNWSPNLLGLREEGTGELNSWV